jgi:hypothetical protein
MVPVGRVGQAKSIDIAREAPFPTGCHLLLQFVDFAAKFLSAKILLQNYYSEKSALLTCRSAESDHANAKAQLALSRSKAA